MRILFPTDFSDAAEHAFVYALQMAKASKASIVTFHAYLLPDIRGVNLPNTLREVYNSISLEEFDNFRDTIPTLRDIALREGAGDIEIKHVLQQGQSVPAILNAIPANNIDLVIMGTTGAGLLKELFLGSVAAEVMENAEVPVLAVPVGAVFDGTIDKIAVTTELMEEDERALVKILDFARIYDAQVSCVNADVSHTAKYSDRLGEFRAKFPEVEFHVIDTVNVEGSVKAFVEQHQIDILAMVIHKRGKLKEMFTYSMTKRFAYHLRTPILAIQAHTL
jgi:nucleotide-binding universal stress UspA family protein